MKKKVLFCSLLSVAALTAAAVAFAGCNIGEINSTERYRQDHMCFELKDDGTYELTSYEYADLNDGEDRFGNFVEGYKGEGEVVIVPEKVNRRAVTSVDGRAFSYSGVKEVTLPDAINVLPEGLFSGCTLLEKVNCSVITEIEEFAFCNCESLASIEFQDGLTEIGERAFDGCTSLTALTLPDSVTAIGENCFYECVFESINTSCVETLGKGAFYKCANVTSLNLPNVKTIGESAFDGCDKLTEMIIGGKLEECNVVLKGLTKISIDSPIPEKLFQGSANLKDVTLGGGVTSIGESSFAYCTGVTEITLPATLTDIGKSAFSQSGLTGAVTIPASVKTIGDNAFYGCGKVTGLTVGNGVEIIGSSAFERCGITALSLPASVKSVGDRAFAACNMCKSITLAYGLEGIGSSAFSLSGDEALEIVLPSSVKTLGNSCFSGITANKIIINDAVETVGTGILRGGKVKELTVPASYDHNISSVEKLMLFGEGEIPANAYQNVAALKTVDLGGGVKRIGENAFKTLDTISLVGVEYMGKNALGDLSSLACLKTENGVKTLDGWVISSDYSQGGATNLDLSEYTGIYHDAFRKTATNDTSPLTTVALTGSDDTSRLKFIGSYAFAGSGITGCMVPASIETWDEAFRDCKALTYVSIQRGVEKIAEGAFRNCTNLDGLNFAATDINEIGISAFYDCKGLRLVTLPESIKKIDGYAFSYCKSLMTIDLKGAEEIEDYAFNHCSDLSEATMNSIKKIGAYAFNFCDGLTEFDLPATLTEICLYALDDAQTVNYAGTKEQWEAIAKGGSKYSQPNGMSIWYGNNDLIIYFADGSSVTLPKDKD